MAYECRNCSLSAVFCSTFRDFGCCQQCDHRPNISLVRAEFEAVQFDYDMSALYELRSKVTLHGLDFPQVELDIWAITFDLFWDDITQLLNNWPTDVAATQIAEWKAKRAEDKFACRAAPKANQRTT
jgi:hypothetical protein